MGEELGKRPFAERIKEMGVQPGSLPGLGTDSPEEQNESCFPVVADGAIL